MSSKLTDEQVARKRKDKHAKHDALEKAERQARKHTPYFDPDDKWDDTHVERSED